MPQKFKNKYRILSHRLQDWDYGSNGSYFVTICTQNRVHYFGEIESGKMILNVIGEQAETSFREIPIHFPFVKLGNFVVMPDHVHAIIIINKPDEIAVETQDLASPQTPTSIKHHVETQDFASLHKFGPQSKNLASIVRGYKIGVTKFTRTMKIDFAWQPRFYDHIIRNSGSFERIQNYIINNPLNWKES
jgi:REP element-mobilizing transposase RayT